MFRKVLTREFWDPRIGIARLTWLQIIGIFSFSAFFAAVLGLIEHYK